MHDPIVIGTASLGVALLALAAYRALRSDRLSDFGRFEGRVVATWDDDGRNMTLIEDFAYVDPAQKRWDAPKHSVVNGASIPQTFWSLIGGPFEGQYRNASVVHDVYCVSMSEPWEDVHRMFYHACRCGGVGEGKAKLLYFAVYHYGPRWGDGYDTRLEIGAPAAPGAKAEPAAASPARPPSPEEIEKMVAYFDVNNPTMEQIELLDLPSMQDRKP